MQVKIKLPDPSDFKDTEAFLRQMQISIKAAQKTCESIAENADGDLEMTYYDFPDFKSEDGEDELEKIDPSYTKRNNIELVISTT
jgi:hypothetical protein